MESLVANLANPAREKDEKGNRVIENHEMEETEGKEASDLRDIAGRRMAVQLTPLLFSPSADADLVLRQKVKVATVLGSLYATTARQFSKLGLRSKVARAALRCPTLTCTAMLMTNARRSWHRTAREGDEAPNRTRKSVARGAHRSWMTITPLETMEATASHPWSIAAALRSEHPAGQLLRSEASATSTLRRCSVWTLRRSARTVALQQLKRCRH